MTRSIRRLRPETASRIAAGEVIERPLSALKEVLENALDAGAQAVEIRVGRSLDQFFSVADDGHGIAPDELELALERHATSKLEDFDDLDHLATLGFRGEALPSIAAVSRLKIATRRPEDTAGQFVIAEAGTVVERGATPRAVGTTVEVSNLFFNTPARRKFMNSPIGEMRAAVRLLECYGLGYPEVAFRLMVDERVRLDWPAVRGGDPGDPEGLLAKRRERAVGVWGTRHAEQLLGTTGARDGYAVQALLGLPEHARATREGQVFLVNRRWVQSPMLSHALRQAYGNLLPAGRFPACTVWVTIPPERLDVNVHPTKREVRFSEESAVRSLVAGACARPLANLTPPFTVVAGGAPEPQWGDVVFDRPSTQRSLRFGATPEDTGEGASAPPATLPAPEEAAEAVAAPGTGREPAARVAAPAEAPDLWQLHRTYILAPVRGGLMIVDQHAAHERILYEQARGRLEGQVGVSQQLLFPTLVDLSQSQFDLVLELGPWLKQLGWDLSPLAPPSVVVRGVPPEISADHPGHFLQDVLDGVSEATGRTSDQDIAENLARTYACHAAVKAGDALTSREMRALVDRLFATSHPHGDPHGRVTFVRLDLEELNRRFGRS
jgi:DNA mismatch repair protein MutL